MGIQDSKHCPICGSLLKKEINFDTSNTCYVRCEACGRFGIDEDYFEDVIDNPRSKVRKSQIASYLFYQGDRLSFPFLSSSNTPVPQNHRCVSISEIETWYPKTFSEKVDTFLLGLADRVSYMSEVIEFTDEQLESASFANRELDGTFHSTSSEISRQVNYFCDYLIKQEYIDGGSNAFMILPKGLERIDALQRDRTQNSKNVFVAMSFAPEMVPVREAIKNALINCGYIPRIMDEIEHNHQIVPEMLYEIREARFVVAELTGHNNGAYFEAGYALGNGKDVIQVCQKSKFGEDGHFDVKQVNTILWDTPEELTTRLIARIKATIA